MTVSSSSALYFPAMLHGPTGTVRRQVNAQVKKWAREYLDSGGFTPPQRMLPVPPGEPLLMHAGAELEFMGRPATWRVHLFLEVFAALELSVPDEEHPRVCEAFESFCLDTPWGTLFHVESPPPPWSAAHMTRRLAALPRFWDALQGPHYTRLAFEKHTLEGLLEETYRPTLEAWCPGVATSLREHLALTVERMSRATREDCMDAVLRMIPTLVRREARLKHPQVLSDPGFLRERLGALGPEDFEDVSGAYSYPVTMRLFAWDRALGQQ